MAKYRKKPVIVEAFQNGFDVEPEWFISRTDFRREPKEHHCEFIISTLEGEMRAEYMDWIIKGVKNEIYPCDPDIFEMTYEKV